MNRRDMNNTRFNGPKLKSNSSKPEKQEIINSSPSIRVLTTLMSKSSNYLHRNQTEQDGNNNQFFPIMMYSIYKGFIFYIDSKIETKNLTHKRSLAKTLDLSIQPTREHQAEHLEITKQRPERVAESGRGVTLHKKVAVPGHPVSEQGAEHHQPWPSRQGSVQEANERRYSSGEVPPPRRRL
jgi:hypothetical protein